MPAALNAIYRVKPDRRFLGAVAEVHRLVSGRPADTVRVSHTADGWSIAYGGEPVGVLPDLPGFTEGTAVLSAWASHLLERYPLAADSVATKDLDAAGVLINLLDVPLLAAGLGRVNLGWQNRHQAAWLPMATRGLTLLAIQVPRVETEADPLLARALAAAALAHAAGQGAMLNERALLAFHMGYAAEAAALGNGLPRDDPIRLLVSRDTAALHVATAAAPAPPLTRHLYLLDLAGEGDDDHFLAGLRQGLVDHPTSGMLGTAVGLARFETDASLVPLVPVQLAAEFEAIARRPGVLERVRRWLLRRLLQAQPKPSVTWTEALSGEAAGGEALATFERDLSALDSLFSGPFLDGGLLGGYFRAQLHAAFERTCIHYVDGLASAPASSEFVQSLASAPSGLWGDAVNWCRLRASLEAGQDVVDPLIENLESARGLSEPAVRRSMDDIGPRLRFHDPRVVVMARAAFRRLDSRPGHLSRLGIAASDRLRDLPLADRLDGRLLTLARTEYPLLAAWYARSHGDVEGLQTMAADRAFERRARVQAVRYLVELNGDTAGAIATLDGVVAEDPEDWLARDDYIRFLDSARRPADAARIAGEWLEHHDQTRGFDYLFAAADLARQYQRLGRLREARSLLEPLQGSYQLGVMERSALIALDLGEVAAAEDLGTRVVARYPNSPYARVTLAKVRWTQRRYADAARVLNDQQQSLVDSDWGSAIAPDFVGFFSRRPAEAELAFGALLEAGVSASKLSRLPAAAADSGYLPLALALQQRLVNGSPDEALYLDLYRYTVAARGKHAAVALLRQRWSPAEARQQSLSIYRQRWYDLLWDLDPEMDDGVDGSYMWLLRTLAWLQTPERDPEHYARLVGFYRRLDPRWYHVVGQYLLGMQTEATVLILTDTPHRRTEASYYLGVKALSERRYANASDWFRVTVEAYNEHDWEWLWAKDLLQAWAATGRELTTAVPLAAARPPGR
jgi:hypothetical protein